MHGIFRKRRPERREGPAAWGAKAVLVQPARNRFSGSMPSECRQRTSAGMPRYRLPNATSAEGWREEVCCAAGAHRHGMNHCKVRMRDVGLLPCHHLAAAFLHGATGTTEHRMLLRRGWVHVRTGLVRMVPTCSRVIGTILHVNHSHAINPAMRSGIGPRSRLFEPTKRLMQGSRAAGSAPPQLRICAQSLSSRLVLTGCGVRSSCAKKLTRSSSSSQRSSSMRASTAPLRSATRRQ